MNGAVYEITGNGYNGDTDATDDRVLWVIGTGNDVAFAIMGLKADMQCMAPAWQSELHVAHPDVDFVLPRDILRLRATLMQWE